MGLDWGSVLKLTAVGAFVMLALSAVMFFVFQNIGYDSFLLSIVLCSTSAIHEKSFGAEYSLTKSICPSFTFSLHHPQKASESKGFVYLVVSAYGGSQ